MKKINIYFLFFFSSLLISPKMYSQSFSQNFEIKDPVGQYISDRGSQFFIKNDSSFYILKGRNKAFDVAMPGCDTISKGTWHFISKSILRLSNDKTFQHIRFNISEENRLSGDSIYLKIDLPKDDAFVDGRFKYQISIMGKIDFLESISPMIAFPKKKVFENGNLYYHLALLIQDMSPLNCEFNGKCYQRIYFNIINDYELNVKSNFFTIKLNDFNDCYVERADVNNQFVFIVNNRIHWQDLDFVRVK